MVRRLGLNPAVQIKEHFLLIKFKTNAVSHRGRSEAKTKDAPITGPQSLLMGLEEPGLTPPRSCCCVHRLLGTWRNRSPQPADVIRKKAKNK